MWKLIKRRVMLACDKLLCYLLMAVVVSPAMPQAYWWTLGRTDVLEMSTHALMSVHKFNMRQRSLLGDRLDYIKAVSDGSNLAIHHCKKQFKHRKWNCSSYSTESVFGKVLRRACRETSFIYAITSAGITHSLTRACANGTIAGCRCNQGDRNPKRLGKDSWMYEGCHDNIQFGYKFAKKFSNSFETSRDFRAIVNLHNNEAGRMAVVRAMGIKCTCHGVSGACNVQTCFRKLSNFKQVSDLLKREYDTAAKVTPRQIKGARRRSQRHALMWNEAQSVKPKQNNLVYFEESPDFCKHDLSQGSLGVQGRSCNASRTERGTHSCDIMCCGGNYRTETKTMAENCRCVFKWCCKVTCQKCMVTKDFSKCLGS